jgi:hypothetical protein
MTTISITTLAPDPFDLISDIKVVVEGSDGEFIATFFDANIGMSGDTEEEAVSNLKAIIVDTFELYEENEAVLGPGPQKQLAVLRKFIQKKA